MTAAFPGEHDSGLQVLGDGRPRRGVPARLLRLASDERLVDGVRGGSEASFEALFDRYHRGVLGFCRHMLGSVEEAEDAVQHTFLAAYRELVGSTAHVVFRPWIYTIARNRCLTMLRTRARQSTGELVEPPTEHLAAAVERRHDLRELLGDVSRLPDDQREALVLSELGDMSHDEIADVLGCRRDKVKALVFQARTSLIASRSARDTSCAEIREQLANLRGGSLRRNELRRHVNECAGCREFRDQVRAQRRDLALVLPVAPTVGLKSAVFGGGVAGSTAAAATGGGGGALAAKVLVVAAIAGTGTVAVSEEVIRNDPPAPAPQSVAPAVRESSHTPATGAPATIGTPSAVPLRGDRPASAPGHSRAKPVPPGHARRERSKPDHPAHPAAPGLVGKPTKEERDAAKADRQAANDQAKAERNAAKADRKAAHDQAKADRKAARDQAKAERNAAKAERKAANPGKVSKPVNAPAPVKPEPPNPPQAKAPAVPEPVPAAPAPGVGAPAQPGNGAKSDK